MPKNARPIDYYLGIELNPPDAKWIFACAPLTEMERRLRNLVNDIPTNKKFKLLKGNTLGFSKLKPVKDIASQPTTIIVLTSFILYQFDNKTQKMLKDEISGFIDDCGGHWINQEVTVTSHEFFIAFDGKKIIELPDDTCISWKWL